MMAHRACPAKASWWIVPAILGGAALWVWGGLKVVAWLL